MEAYTILDQLGRGAMGEVFRVRRTADDVELALKRAGFAELPREEQKQSLLEVALLSRLRHPNIVKFLDHFFEAGDLCIAMEIAPSDLLHELRAAKKANTPIAEPRLRLLLSQIGSALHYAHGCGVLHRDVKPANVLLAADGTPLLSDFGISFEVAAHELHLGRELRASTGRAGELLEGEGECPKELQGELRGTPAYMALPSRPSRQRCDVLARLRRVVARCDAL